jgi:hypothetical protein
MLTGGFIIKGWGQIVLLGTTTIKDSTLLSRVRHVYENKV